MKLLNKKTIAQQKSLEKKQEIDEGIKLAKRIDVLRETSAIEESRLAKFRDESLKHTKNEIAELIAERDKLRAELTQTQGEYQARRIPVDAGWQDLKQEQAKLRQTQDDLDGIMRDIQTKEALVDEKLREIELDEQRIADSKEDAAKILSDVYEKSESATKVLEQAYSLKRTEEYNLTERARTIDRREAGIAVREREVEIALENIKNRDEEITRRETLVNDRYNTLLRTEARIKNGNSNTTTKPS